MRTWRMIAAIAVLLLAVAACEADDTEETGDEPDDTENAVEREDEPDDPDEDEGREEDEDEAALDEDAAEEVSEAEEGRFVHEYDEPVVWEEGDFRMEISGVAISSRRWLLSEVEGDGFEAADIEAGLDDDTETLFLLEVEASHHADRQVSWYPDQGELIVGDRQVDADMWFTGDVGHTDWEPGTTRNDDIVWQLPTPWDEVVAHEEAEYRVRGASDMEDFDFEGPDAAIELTWPND